MTYPQSGPPSQPTPVGYDPPIDTGSRGLAITAFVLGIIALIPLIGIPFGIAAIICGIIAIIQSGQPHSRVAGKGFAITGLVLGCVGFLVVPVIALLIAILLPSLGKARELANRSYCAANLRGLAQSMIVYSAENSDQFPVLPYAPYSSANGTASAAPGAATADDTIKTLYASPSPQAGSPLAAQWILVLRNQCATKQFICKSDPNITAAAALQTSTGQYYDNFQADNQLSYSFAYPYTADGKVGPWWSNTTDSSLPIMADMAPQNGTGTPARDVTAASLPRSPKIWNSANHQGDGQNVAFADTHVEFDRRPDIGQSNDNIYTTSGIKDVAEFGGAQPVKSPVNIYTGKTVPFDIYMVPTRNLTTGGL